MVQKSKQRLGSKNGRWKGGISSDYRRRITHAKPGEIVHHKDHNKKNNSKNNLQVLKPGKAKIADGTIKKITAIGKHNKLHPEKGRKKRK